MVLWNRISSTIDPRIGRFRYDDNTERARDAHARRRPTTKPRRRCLTLGDMSPRGGDQLIVHRSSAASVRRSRVRRIPSSICRQR